VDQALVPRFGQHQRKLADLGPGACGGQAQRDSCAEEGVLAPGAVARPGRGPEAGVPGPPHAPRVHRSQRLGIGNKVCPHARTIAGQQRVGQRGARAEILHQHDAGLSVGAQQARSDRVGHPVQVLEGSQLDPEGVLARPFFQYHTTVRGQMQPGHGTPVPDRLCRAPTSGPRRGPAAPRLPGSRPPTGLARWPPRHSRRPGPGTAKD
jgi:hypothetical protein